MLTSETKQKINNARDILVGKIPTPTGQVEQITLALIYKFMNDIDEQNIELGGKSKFFNGDYKQYAWKHILDKSLSAYERVTLYGEGLEKMHRNPNLPQFFRDVFKNAFLPFRDPEVLTLFLKQLDEFRYEHSEDLGDAFEFLLLIMDTQGQAGQLRTPRHIIDFIVDVVEPDKNDRISDVACGTAGFLISAYKHILKQNTEKGSNKPGSKLTFEERKRLTQNFVGYDISHDMVRLSLVNMYLHGFPDPKIYEYDTLTSLDKWDDDFECMLANPPFMTPKGGIRPHRRFSIRAKRSEVLFVDYIMEHLTPNGKAGVIVPEGIIFQSANAYKALRKMLVDQNYLYAVVSLPGGVFQPYSGVKTSILFMDRVLAKKTRDILFVKIENDGFDLGAQRKPIEKNDLPKALVVLKKYKITIKQDQELELTEEEKKFAHLVAKEKISQNGDYNLTGNRYKETILTGDQRWPMRKIGSLCNLTNGRAFKPSNWEREDKGGLPIIRIQNLNNRAAEFNYYSGSVDKKLIVSKGDLLFSWSGSKGTSFGPHIWYGDKGILNQHIFKVDHSDNISRYFFYFMLKKAVHEVEEKLHGGVGLVHITKGNFEEIEIPLPPLEVQQEIVTQLDSYQKVIDGAKQVIINYKPEIKIDPNWEIVELGRVMEVNSKTTDPSQRFRETGFIYIDISSVENGTGFVSFDNKIKGTDAPSRARRVIKNGDVLLSTVRPNLKAFAYLSDIPDNSIASTGFAVLSPKGRIIGKFAYYLLFHDLIQSQMIERMSKGSYPSINQKDVQQLRICLPPIPVQHQIVARIEEEQQLVSPNKKLVQTFEQKIKEKIDEVWG